MSIKLRLDSSGKLYKKGYAIYVDVYISGKRKRIYSGYFSRMNDWDKNRMVPLPSHPDYELLFPEIVKYKQMIKELNVKRSSFEDAIEKLTIKKEKMVSFSDFSFLLIDEKKQIGKRSNAKIYANVIKQFENFLNKKIEIDDINYNLLNAWKYYLLRKVKPVTVHNYLRTVRAIYNEAVRRGIVDGEVYNFKGLFDGLSIRSSMNRKKYIDKIDILKLELIELSGVVDYVRDLFLMQFYLGGQDLIDVYYLKKSNINNGRVYIERKKLAGKGYVFDLKIFEKMQKIIDKYTGNEFLFPGRKDAIGYETFRRRYGRYLINLQNKLEINVIPSGGNMGIKVTRHTFANIGKKLIIDTDMLRELMGHERNDVDNFYKDRFPEKMRDDAHWKIIDTTNY